MRGCAPRGQWNVLEMSHLKMHSDNDCHCSPACKAASWSPVLSALALELSCAFSHSTPCSESQVDALLSLYFRFFLSCRLKFPMPLKVTSHALLVTLCPMSCPGINVNPPTPSLLLSPQPDRHFTINWKTSAFKLLPGDWAGINTRVSQEARVNSGTYANPWWWLSSVAQSCLTLWEPMDCGMPGFPVPHHPDRTQDGEGKERQNHSRRQVWSPVSREVGMENYLLGFSRTWSWCACTEEMSSVSVWFSF